jgi:hypothetical protein
MLELYDSGNASTASMCAIDKSKYSYIDQFMMTTLYLINFQIYRTIRPVFFAKKSKPF